MPLDKNFVFSANNLQDFVDCPRRFELKYILNQSWPAILSQPVQELEEKMAQGSDFHRLAFQLLEGLPEERLSEGARSSKVRDWLERFTGFISPFRKDPYFSEYASYTTIGRYRVVAVFDFITRLDDGQIIIADWKTTESQPRREYYQERIQTLLYPLVAFETAEAIFGFEDDISPSDISLLYWFPAYPEKSIEFPFSISQLNHTREYLSNLIAEIAEKELGDFPKTDDLRRCDFCQYRSLCERGVKAAELGEIQELDIETLIESLDFDNP
jgi:CRISPR/Cas system-associated exonuclease Cas4 (RecB family)